MFKGGTRLLLHDSKINRLSIDIDIIYGGDIEIFNEKLVEISNNLPFTRLEEHKRGHRGLPNRRHFKFFYNSTISKNEEYVLLDIVLENPAYITFTEIKLIKTDLFDIANSFNEISIAYRAAYIKETGYKDNDFSEKQVLQDTIDTCHSLLQIRLRGYKNNLAAINLPAPFQRLNRLKQIIPEAFYYIWLGTVE